MSCLGKGCVKILGKGDIKCSGLAAEIEQTTSSQPSAVYSTSHQTTRRNANSSAEAGSFVKTHVKRKYLIASEPWFNAH